MGCGVWQLGKKSFAFPERGVKGTRVSAEILLIDQKEKFSETYVQN